MIYISADDYGLSPETAERIEACIESSALNKVSVFPNGVIQNITQRISKEQITLSLHLNVVEGKCLSNPRELSLLVTEEGYFKHSFEGLFFLSLSPKRKQLKEQLKKEFRAQILYWKKVVSEEQDMVIDSHQHIHMIPLVFRVLMELIREEGISVQYMRFPAEPILPYLLSPSLYLTYSPVNLTKQWLLKFLGVMNQKEWKASGIRTALFMGILFSGHMDEKRVTKVLPRYEKLAQKRGMNIELLFHPGYMEQGEMVLDAHKTGFNRFYFSKGRRIEYDAVRQLHI